MAYPFVTEIRDQDAVQGTFLALRKSLLQSRNGSPYLAVTLSDRTGEIEARAWEDAERLDQAFERGDYVRVDAVGSMYGGRVQLKIQRAHSVPTESINPRDFVPATRFDVEQMWRELREMVDGIGDAFIRRILDAFLDDPRIGPALKRAPAAKSVHHAFSGGLLEHTLSVMQLAHRIADHYPRANRDLLVAGAMLHDIGKTRELSFEEGIDYTTEGRLVGHLLLTVQWIHEKAGRIPGFPPDLAMHLTHLVAAHHGQLEHGSPKVPHTLEAMIVHALDELDSRMQSWTALIDRDTASEEWTSFQRLYDRPLYKGPGWGRERAGLPPVAEGKPWSGTSLYRREARGEIQPIQAPEPGELPPKGTRRRAPARPEAVPSEPAVADLFSRTGTHK